MKTHLSVKCIFIVATSCLLNTILYAQQAPKTPEGERINLNRNMRYTGENFGWRFGINSGVSFTTPDVPWMKDKQETPVNRNVRIYNPN